ncbi:MAG: hypothetical protein ACOH1M_05975 [Rhodoglobus sp.]
MAVSSTFNAAGQLTGEYRGRLEGATRIGYAYNGAGQRTQQAAATPDGTTSSHYTYTGAGKLATLAHDDTTTLGYDGIDLVSRWALATQLRTRRVLSSIWNAASLNNTSAIRSSTG